MLTLARAALAALMLAMTSLPALAQTRVALLIGNQDYTHERKLRNPVADASLLGRVLKDDLKFDTVRVERNLDANGMDRVIDEFAAQAKGAGTVVFYYSGHGMTSPGDRRAYLLPTDARTGVPGAPRLERQAVSAEAVRDRLRALGARVTLLILDACRDGPGAGKSGDKGLARVGGGNQLLVAYATEEGKVAADGTGANSPYAEALAQAWRQPGLTVLQQLDLVADQVSSRIPDQQPTREGNLRADTWLGASPFAPVRPDDRNRIEDEAWALCRNAASTVPCDDYLSGWPQGRYTALARTRLRELRAADERQQQQQRQQQAAVVEQPPRVGQVVKDCDVCPELVVIPTGSFMMGSPAGEAGRDDDETQHRVTMGRRYALGKYEVTQGQWRAVMGSNPSRFKECGDECPVESVSWNEVQEYLRKLNERTGGRYGFRLPSEAEWEYAARAGTQTAYAWGSQASHEWANYGKDECCGGLASGRDRWVNTAPVGQFAANGWGLHDMAGNVWELVQDCHGDYAQAPTDGSAKDDSNCAQRGRRGGSWIYFPQWLRSANRNISLPGIRYNDAGFRVARTF